MSDNDNETGGSPFYDGSGSTCRATNFKASAPQESQAEDLPVTCENKDDSWREYLEFEGDIPQVRLCKDCDHMVPSEWGPGRSNCSEPRHKIRAGINLVSGYVKTDWYGEMILCCEMRDEKGKCGPDGVLFEAKSDV